MSARATLTEYAKVPDVRLIDLPCLSALGMDRQPWWLDSPALLTPFHFLVLPRLAAKDLVRLSCTCRDLRAALDCAPPSSWHAAADAALPQPLSSSSWPEAQVLLNRYGLAKHNLKQNRDYSTFVLATEQELPSSSAPIFSPDGALLCVMTFFPAPLTELLDPIHFSCGTTVAVHQVHTGLAFQVRVPGSPRTCVFTHDTQQLILAEVELGSSEGLEDDVSESSQAKTIFVTLQFVSIREDGLKLSRSTVCRLPAHTATHAYLQASFAPGGRFMAVQSYAELGPLPAVKSLFLVDVNLGRLAHAPILLPCSDRVFAWHADGCKLAMIEHDGAVHLLDLIDGREEKSLACELGFWRVRWPNKLVGYDLLGTATVLSDPYSAPDAAMQYPSQLSMSFSPCDDLTAQIDQSDNAPLSVKVHKTGQPLCTLALATEPTDGEVFHMRCSWSPGAQFWHLTTALIS